LRRGSIRKGRHRRSRQIDGAKEEEEGEGEGKDGGEEKVSLHTSTPADWAEQARKRAILSLEARNPPAAKFLERKINNDIKQKKKKNKNKNKNKKDRIKEEEEGKGMIKEMYRKVFVDSKKSEREPSLEWMRNGGSARKNGVDAKIDDDADADADAYGKIDDVEIGEDEDVDIVKIDVEIDEDEDSDIDDIDGLLEATEPHDWEQHANARQLDPDAMSERNRNVEERVFNRRLVETTGASDVLEIIDRIEEAAGSPSLLTPFNVATALHRIAKHMEASAAHESERLAFARKRSMAKLVARAMEVLHTCSAQGLANIAWALSKVGGRSLYFSEMDLVARVSLPKASEFNAQNVANMSGAYASMRHAAPDLFAKLCDRASAIVETFSPQELAQVLWAHAELAQAADPLLYALDRTFAMPEERCNVRHDQSTATPSSAMIKPFRNASAEHLSNVAWSYSALDQIERPSFRHIWRMLEDRIAQDRGENRKVLSVWHLCQLHQVNLCLQYEYPQLGLSLSASLKNFASEAWKTQKSNSSASAYQKDVQWHLMSTGKGWVTEYRDADYSLDFALVEEKIALEFDGPSHFIRNTGELHSIYFQHYTPLTFSISAFHSVS
jgi:hypothetical protein